MARRSVSTSTTRSWRQAREPEPWWQRSGSAWQERPSVWEDRPRGWQDTSSGWRSSGWQEESSGRAWQDTSRWQRSGRASADERPVQERMRGEEERHEDSHVLRCPWPGPFTKSFPRKGAQGDWGSTVEAAASAGLVT